MALVDFLIPPLVVSSAYPTSNIILTHLRSLIPNRLKTADPHTGAWSLVISRPLNREGNYIETSGSAMLIFGMLKAVWLVLVENEDNRNVAAAKKAYEYFLRENMVWSIKDGPIGLKGTVQVGSLG
jgi:rhamnogalacturonyl hydrolase YesR